jgi:hypothetical protein
MGEVFFLRHMNNIEFKIYKFDLIYTPYTPISHVHKIYSLSRSSRDLSCGPPFGSDGNGYNLRASV